VSICELKKFSGGYTPGPPLKGEGRGGRGLRIDSKGMDAPGKRSGKEWKEEDGEGRGADGEEERDGAWGRKVDGPPYILTKSVPMHV
jgi:hypothetical protein